MTLITLIAAPWGVWHCADKRLIRLETGEVYDDNSVKHVTLTCSDGHGVITYTGVGALRDGRHLSEWIRDQLIGESRTVDQSLTHLRERATRDLAPALHRRGLAHVFMLSAIFGDGGVWIGEIANVNAWGGQVQREFVTRAQRIENAGFVGIGGVRDAVTPADLALLQRLKDVRPKRMTDYLGLLANVNRRAAAHSNLISEACWTTAAQPTGEGPGSQEFFGESRTVAMSHLLFGIDLSPLTEVFHRHIQRREQDPDFDLNSDEAQAEREAAARRGTGETR